MLYISKEIANAGTAVKNKFFGLKKNRNRYLALGWNINYTLVYLSKRVKTKERICLLIKNANITSVIQIASNSPSQLPLQITHQH